jgi:ArsR family transcriptional regulator
MTTFSNDLRTMHRSAGRAAQLMKVLANPDRLMLLCQLAEREMCVSDLQRALGIVQPTLSQQLTVLRKERVVATRREGKRIFYRVSSREALGLIRALYQHYCPQGAA